MDGKNRNPSKVKFSAAKWGSRYSYGPLESGFENLSGPLKAMINPDSAWSDDLSVKWKLIAGRDDEKEQTVNTSPFQSFYILQDIETLSAVNQLFETGGGDGIQVWLNGENLVKHLNERESHLDTELVLLPLKAGKNQLLIKFNNRYGYLLNYKINTKIDQVLYKQNLSPRNFSGVTNCTLKLHHPESEHQPIRMNNIRIEL
jgi:alpha-L-fucosidase